MALRFLTRKLVWGGTLTVRGVGTTAVKRHYSSPTLASVPMKPERHVIAGGLTLMTFSIPFITVGAYAAKMMASGLEDLDLFVPDDDDD